MTDCYRAQHWNLHSLMVAYGFGANTECGSFLLELHFCWLVASQL